MATKTQIAIGGRHISFLKTGEGKDLILFIHGNSMAAENWLPQLENEDLNSSYSLVAIDLPGHGSSEWSNGNALMYHPAEMAKTLEPLLDQLGAKKFILVGLSLGTNVIMMFPAKGFL